jgi:glycosyltransferase involved in cell wall biosynthesis
VIRVGFVVPENSNWLGGINYYNNLIGAIRSNTERKIEPVLIPVTDSVIKPIIMRLFRRDLITDRYLTRFAEKNDIAVISHYGSLGKNSSVPTIGWIPDFQHKYYPEFFSKNDISGRDKIFRVTCSECDRVIFSSNTARGDAERFYPDWASKYRVLHFAVSMDLFDLPDFESLKEKYQIEEPYFLIPNQFWVHKNHNVVIEALKILNARGDEITVISTGGFTDYRNPGYFNEIKTKIESCYLSNQFKILGIIPYGDVVQLMLHAEAVINPSLFEGWSTSVEESKALGLTVILSDIPVHREQNPDHGIYFPAHDREGLANILKECPGKNKMDLKAIQNRMTKEKQRFAQEYEKIVLEAIE